MIKKRKGQGLSLNVVILAILALVVLIVLVSIFSKQTGKSVNILESCAGRGGECRSNGCLDGEFKLGTVECSDKKICCVNLLNKNDK